MIRLTEDEKLGSIGNNEQYHYSEFKNWEDAFRQFYRKKLKDKSFCLVISTHWLTSGYWVERNATNDEYARVYRSVKAVKELEARIRERGEEVVRTDGTKRKDCLSLGELVI